MQGRRRLWGRRLRRRSIRQLRHPPCRRTRCCRFTCGPLSLQATSWTAGRWIATLLCTNPALARCSSPGGTCSITCTRMLAHVNAHFLILAQAFEVETGRSQEYRDCKALSDGAIDRSMSVLGLAGILISLSVYLAAGRCGCSCPSVCFRSSSLPSPYMGRIWQAATSTSLTTPATFRRESCACASSSSRMAAIHPTSPS